MPVRRGRLEEEADRSGKRERREEGARGS